MRMGASVFLSIWILVLPLFICNAQNIDWISKYGGTGGDAGSVVTADSTNNVYLAGVFSGTADFGTGPLVSAGGIGLVIAKYNPSGLAQWTFGFSTTNSSIIVAGIKLDVNGNIFICGAFNGTMNFGGTTFTSAGQQDCFLAKYSASGSHIWSHAYGSTNGDQFLGLAVDLQGNIIVTGQFLGSVDFGGGVLQSRFGTQPNIVLAKYSSDLGSNIWSEVFLSNNQNIGRGIAVDINNNIFVTGDFAPAVNFGNGNLTNVAFNIPNIFVAKFNSAGSNIWAKRYGGSKGDRGTAISIDNNGDIVIGGMFSLQTDLGGGTINGTGFNNDLFLAKYSNIDGSYIWGLALNTSTSGWVNSISTDNNKNILISGYFQGTLKAGSNTLASVAGSTDGFVGKYAFDSSFIWATSYGGTGDDQITSIVADSNNRAIITGGFSGTATFGPYTLVSTGGGDAFLLTVNFSTINGNTYYMDSGKIGTSNNTGTNRANAFTNWTALGSTDGLWTGKLHGGDTLLIFPGVGYVGNRTGVPDAIVMYGILGLTNNPIIFKAAQAEGLVITPPFVVNGSFFTFDGRKSDIYTNIINFDNMANLYQITNNINWWMRGVYGFGSNHQNGIYCPNSGAQMKFTWIHVDPYTFNTNNWPFGSSESGVGANTHGVNILQNTGEILDGGEIAYCYIEEADQCGIAMLNNNAPKWQQFRIHHNVITKMGDAGARLAGGFEVDHNIIGKPWMIHGHPNGVVQSPSFSLFHHNIVYNTLDTMMYTPGGGSPIAFGIKVYNNLFYTTKDWSFIYTNEWSSNLPFVNHSIGGFQFLVEANANNTEPWLPQTWNNFFFAQNTVIAGYGAVSTNANAGINGIISLPNRYAPGNSVSFEPGLDRGFIIISNMANLNNLLYNISPAGSGQTIGGWPGWVDRFNGSTNTWTNNILNATAGILFDWRNTNGYNIGSTNVPLDYNDITADQNASKAFAYNGPYSTNSTFTSAEQFNITYSTNGYTHNTSVIPSLADTNNYDFHPKVNDTTLIGKGTNLAQYTLAPGGLPQYNMDLSGLTRPSNPSIGAYEPQRDLILHYTFDFLSSPSSPALGASPVEHDLTGYNSDMLYFGFISTPTNWPTRVVYTNRFGPPGYAAHFEPDYGTWNLGHPGGQYGAITNIAAFTNLSAITVCVWANYWPHTNGQDNVATLMDVTYGTNGVSWAIGRDSAWQTSFSLYTNLNCNTSSALHINYPDDDSIGGTNLSPGTGWHFYVGTFNVTNHMMRGYLDGTNFVNTDFTRYSLALTNLTVGFGQTGVASGLCSAGGVFPGYLGWIAIGCRTHSGTPNIADGDGFPNNGWFHGDMHDNRVYNRELSAGEILALYNGGSGSIPSSPIIPPPTFTQQPASTNVYATQSASFTVVVNGTAPLTYQWTTNGVAAGSNSPSLFIGPCPVTWNGMHVICVVTNLFGSATSSTATLGVLPDPVITAQPNNATVGVGSTASFNVVATGQSTLLYQWYKNGSFIIGATLSSYTTPATVAGDNNSQYLVNVADNAGNLNSATATLTVTNIISPPDPVITAQPQSTNIFNTQAAIFSLTATGATTIVYQWKTNGVNAGTNGPVLAFNSCPIAWNGMSVLCVVSDTASNVTSSIATLTISPDPVITSQPHNSVVFIGTTATFSVTATGQTAITYQWSQNGLTVTGATNSVYTTPPLGYPNNGDDYFADVTDSAGTLRSSTATLTVLPPPLTNGMSNIRATNLRIRNGGKIVITH